MLKALVDAALGYRFLVLVAFGAIALLGWRAVLTVPIDAFPDVTPNQVNIYTESPGLASEDVEQLLTFPIESGLAGLPGVIEIRSVSLFGLSYVSIYFVEDMDIYFARRLVMERLQEVSERLPQGYGTPEMGPNTSGLSQVFWYTLERTDEHLSQAITDLDLRTLHDWTVRLILRTAPGVDDVTSWGGQERQFQVVIDPLQLLAYELTLKDVINAIQANNAQVGGQYINVGKEHYVVRGLGLVSDEQDIGDVVLRSEHGTPVRLSDVASIRQAGAQRFGAVTRDGKEVVLGMALSRTGENAAAVVESVTDKIELVNQSLPEGVVLRPVYERTELVDKAVGTAVSALVEGSLLVAIVLFLFLGDFRSAIVVISALPTAMLIAFIFMQQVGISSNLMSLAGLAVGIGMMVDGAVVMVENVHRKLSGRTSGEFRQAVLEGAREVASPVSFAIIIIVVVFIPLFSLEGLEGKLFKPMAYNISFAMAGSLLITLTLIPVLASLILSHVKEGDTRLVSTLKRGYLPVLYWSLDHKKAVVGVALLLLAVTVLLFPFLGRAFMPQLQEGSIMWRVSGIPSSSLDQSVALSIDIEEALAEFPEVDSTVAMIGRAEKGETADMNYMEIYTSLHSEEEWQSERTMESLVEAMRERLEVAAPTAVFAHTQPIQMRVEELISGVRAVLAAKIYGENLQELDRLSAEIKDVIASIEGAADLSLEANLGKPQIQISVKRDQLARFGMNAEEVLTLVRAGIGNEPVSTLIDGVRRFDITVRFDSKVQGSIDTIANIPLKAESGAILPLSRVADIRVAEGYSFIRREQLQRYSVIQMDVRGRDIDGFVREANQAIASQVDLPPGYWIEWGGAFENQQRALARLSLIVPLTIFFIFVLLYTTFNSVRYATLILANVPFAAIGGIAALFVTNQYVSVPSAIGLITVFGVAMLNGVVLVSFINELRQQGASVAESVRRGAELRLRPVLMTATVAILGLLPMLLSSGVGAETQRPLATVVVGGLISSTLLTLVLLPVIYEWMESKE